MYAYSSFKVLFNLWCYSLADKDFDQLNVNQASWMFKLLTAHSEGIQEREYFTQPWLWSGQDSPVLRIAQQIPTGYATPTWWQDEHNGSKRFRGGFTRSNINSSVYTTTEEDYSFVVRHLVGLYPQL